MSTRAKDLWRFKPSEHSCPYCERPFGYLFDEELKQDQYICEACEICLLRTNLGSKYFQATFNAHNGFPWDSGGKPIVSGAKTIEEAFRKMKLKAFE